LFVRGQCITWKFYHSAYVIKCTYRSMAEVTWKQ
jgi:hypothetical protein